MENIEKMEDDLYGRQPQWKKTSVEDNLHGRQPQGKMTSVENDLSGTTSEK